MIVEDSDHTHFTPWRKEVCVCVCVCAFKVHINNFNYTVIGRKVTVMMSFFDNGAHLTAKKLRG